MKRKEYEKYVNCIWSKEQEAFVSFGMDVGIVSGICISLAMASVIYISKDIINTAKKINDARKEK